MFLSDNEEPAVEKDAIAFPAEMEQEKTVPAFMQIIRLFRRTYGAG